MKPYLYIPARLLIVAGSVASALALHAATLTTDKADYAPGSTAIISGSGFTAGESVTLEVLHADNRVDNDADHQPWNVTADADGNVSTTWGVCTDAHDCIGATFVVSAVGADSGAQASATFSDSLPTDFHQAANDDTSSGYAFGNVHWINSILQQNDSAYVEGSSTLQRFIVSSLPATNGNVHTLQFSHQANKSTTTHAYDYITSWDQGVAAANQLLPGSFTNINSCGPAISLDTVCSGLHATGYVALVSAPDHMGTNIGDNIDASIAAYEALFGNRTIKLYGDQPITGGSMTFDGYTGSGDLFANYTLTWTSAATSLVIELAGHIAEGADPFKAGIGYGAGRGASSINGGPYHFKLANIDQITLGSQDNQLKGADIIAVPDCSATNNGPVCSGTTLQLGTTNVANATFAWTGPNGFTSTNQNPVITNVTAAAAGTYTVTVTLGSAQTTCSTIAQVNQAPSVSVSSNNVSCTGSADGSITLNVSGTGPFTFAWSNGSTNQNLTGLSAGTYTVTVTGAGGCTATAGATLRVIDTQPPVLHGVPANATAQCDNIPTVANVTATDSVDPNPTVTFSQTNIAGSCVGSATIRRTWTATDACGNSVSATQVITVVDTTAPVIAGVGPNSTVQCDSIPNPDQATATDNCDPNPSLTYQQTKTAGACANSYTLTRRWVATDSCGNSSTATQIITVVDTTAPVLHGVPANVTAQCDAVPTAGNPTATDNCDTNPVVSFNETKTAGACANSYTLTRTWTATDACGNSSTGSQTVTVIDTTAPVLHGVPANVTAQCDTVPSAAHPTATDNCDTNPVVSLNETKTAGACANSYTLTRTWTATDACGNSSTGSQVITVVDTTAPVLSGVPSSTTVQCDAVPTAATPSATDNCDTNPVVSLTERSTPGSCGGSYVLLRIWTATDACGNTSTGSQTITVISTAAPAISGVPTDVTIACNAHTVDPTVTASGQCDPSPTVTMSQTQSQGACAGTQILTRVWTAVDACGNVSSATQHVTLVDTNPPSMSGCPSDQTVECLSDLPGKATVTATTTCGGSADITYTETQSNPGSSCSNLVTRTWTADNGCGVLSTCTQHILVADDLPPRVASAPQDQSITCFDATTFGTPTFQDNCDTNVNVTSSDSTATNQFGATVYTRTWTATDACGNSSTVAQNITVTCGSNSICAFKFDDVNADGIFDGNEVGIQGWQIVLTGSFGSITNLTDATGIACFNELPDGDYLVVESVSQSGTWLAMTTNAYHITLAGNSAQVSFGNLCLGPGGGLTIGFWHNKNGLAALNAMGVDAALTMLRNLNLRNADGSNFDPKTAAALQTWINSATGKNASFMLSAQLAALELNCMGGFVDSSRLLYAPGVGNTGVGNNFITVADLMAKANTALGIDGNAVAGDPNRTYQNALEAAIDNANNDRNFVQPKACKHSF